MFYDDSSLSVVESDLDKAKPESVNERKMAVT